MSIDRAAVTVSGVRRARPALPPWPLLHAGHVSAIGICPYRNTTHRVQSFALNLLSHLPLDRRRGTPTHAPLISATLLEPLPRAHIHIPVQLGAGLLAMDEIAEAAADAALAGVEAAARLAEVGDGGQLAVDGAACVPARVERVAGFLRVFFVLEAHVDVAD